MWSGGEESLVEVKEDGFGNCLTTGDRERERERRPWITFPGNPMAWQESLVGSRATTAKGGKQVSLPAVGQRHVPSAPWGLQMHTGPPEDTANCAPVKSLKLTQQLI